MGGVGEQAKRVACADFLGGRPSGKTKPGELGHQGERPLRESENIYLAGNDRITKIDRRRTPHERHQILRAREVGRREDRQYTEYGVLK